MASTYVPIATTTLGSDATSITLSSISQSYTDLILIANISGYYASATYIECGIQVGNGSIDTGNNYSNTMVDSDTPSSRQSNYNYARFWASALPTSNGTYNPVIIHFQDYSNTTTFKTILTRHNAIQATNDVTTVGASASLWRSTSAINTISISNKNGTNLYAGTTITIYGIKAA